MDWISVKDRLPELFEDVLIVAINENGQTYEKGERYLAIDCLIKWIDGHETSFRTDRLYGTVTHWMPLPKLPNEHVEKV